MKVIYQTKAPKPPRPLGRYEVQMLSASDRWIPEGRFDTRIEARFWVWFFRHRLLTFRVVDTEAQP